MEHVPLNKFLKQLLASPRGTPPPPNGEPQEPVAAAAHPVVNWSAPVVLLSVKPQWGARILSGAKTVELRKFFSRTGLGRHLFLYASHPTQAVVGMARVAHVLRDLPARLWEACGPQSAATREQFDAYFGTAQVGCAIRLDRVRPLPALPLAELRRLVPGYHPPMSHAVLRPAHPIARALLALAERAAACDNQNPKPTPPAAAP